MTKSTWAVIIVVVLMLGVGAAVVYRAPLMQLFNRSQEPAPATTSTPVVQGQRYATTTFSLHYPPDYTLSEAYAYGQFGPKKLIHGISFTIPATMATGTNLSSDTYLSVEQLPRAKKCTGDIFIPANVSAHSITDGGVQYSVATSSGAGAGNFYEEQVYALATSSPCTAVRYYIHSTNISNYPTGTAVEFNRTALLQAFDTIRRSVMMNL